MTTQTQNKRKIHIIAGPTASGKSAKSLEIAAEVNGVIINCDSMQIYNHLAILTAQPSAEDTQQFPHKLYGTLHPNESCSAGNWREMVIPVIEDVLASGKTPVVVGGSGLYIKALIDGLSPMPDIPDDVRNAAVAAYEALGVPGFYDELMRRDPVMAARFHPQHRARLIRAWEVLDATGKSLSEWQEMPRQPPPDDWEFIVHKIIPDRQVLRRRCDERFIWMLENGALEEVDAFQTRIEAGEIRENIPLDKALGFKYLRDYLRGKMAREEAISRSQAETRQYAKRQLTWIRNQM